MALTAAGPDWCSKFPTSKSVDDLKDPFKGKVQNFLGALKDAGIVPTISATYRPPERAYLMHNASIIAGYRDKKTGQWIQMDAKRLQMADAVGLGIDWTCGGDPKTAKHAAEQMCSTYGIVYPAALNSRHTQGFAIDMTMKWEKPVRIMDAKGKLFDLIPGDGTSAEIAVVGASFGVIKLRSDPPHWSSDGH